MECDTDELLHGSQCDHSGISIVDKYPASHQTRTKQHDTDQAMTQQAHTDQAVQIRPPGRTIVVEPLVFLMSLSLHPLMLVSRLYIYAQFEKEIAHQTGFNTSALSGNHSDNCDANKTSPEYIFTQHVQSRNAYYNMCGNIASSVPSIFMIVFFSSYSDKAGRKFSILPPVIAGFAYALVLFLVIMLKLPVWYTLIGSFLEGLGGGHVLIFVGINSYISDTTGMKNRRFRITMVYIVMLATNTAGPIAFGYWIRHSGYLWPSLFTVVVRFISILYATFFIPETIIQTSNARFFSCENVTHSFKVFTKTNNEGRRWRLICIFIAFIIIFTAHLTKDIDTLFELDEPLCWNSVIMGYYETVYVAVAAIGGVLVSWVTRYRASDVTAAILAGVMNMFHYICKGFVTKTYQMFLTSAFSMFSVLFIPSIRTIMSKLVSPYEQGAVFGAMGFAEAIFGFVGGMMFNAIYAKTVWISPGFTFFVCAMFYAVGTAVLIGYALRLRCVNRGYTKLERFDEIEKSQTVSDADTNGHQ